MRLARTTILAAALLSIALSYPPAALAHAEEGSAAPAVYRVEFSIQKFSGEERVDTRNYVMLLEDRGKGSVRVGNRVPYPTTVGAGPVTQYQYADVGLNLDASLRASGDHVLLNVSLQISDLATHEAETSPGPAPTVRQVRSTVSTAVPVGEKTVVCTLDDAVDEQRYAVEVLAVREE